MSLTLDACRWRLGDAPIPVGVAYFSDAVIYSPALNLPSIVIGPGELGMSGQPDEYVDVGYLIAASEIYQWMAYNALVEGRSIT